MDGVGKMKIGLTYDLRSEYRAMGYSEEETAEFDSDETIAAIESALIYNGYVTERIGNVLRLVKELAAGSRWDLVFNFAEGVHGFSREAQVPSLLEAYQIPCTFSDAHVLTLTHHKPTTKQLVREMGIPTPDCMVITSEENIQTCSLAYPVFVKPVAEGTSKGISEKSVVTTPKELWVVVPELLQSCRQPVMVETFLPGREVTIGIVGTGMNARVVGVLEILHKKKLQQEVYSYQAKEFCEQLIDYQLVDDAFAKKTAEMALDVWRKLGCRDAGRLDFRADGNGTPNFIEINPLAGLHPTHSDLPIMWGLGGYKYDALIGEIVSSALPRIAVRKSIPLTDTLKLKQPAMEHGKQD